MKLRRITWLWGITLAVNVVVGCGGDDDDNSGAAASAGANSGGSGSGATGGSSSGGSAGNSGNAGASGNSGASGNAGNSGSSGASGNSGGYFPSGSWFYQDISTAPVSNDSATVTQWLADNGSWGTGAMQIDFSIEVLHAPAGTTFQTFEPTEDFYDPDCDNVPVPLPDGGALEGEEGYECVNDGDCHLIIRSDSDQRLYEMWRANITGGTFYGGCLAAWDMTRVYGDQGRGDQCTSADAAGFPIAPLLFSADEVAAGEINHAIRFILPNARMRDGYFVHPGTHAGGPSGPEQAPVYGSRWRLRSDFPLDSLPSDGARVVARALQKYGMALADGGNIALTAQSDRFTTAKWEGLLDPHDLGSISPTDFEVIDTGAPIELTFDCVRTTYLHNRAKDGCRSCVC